MKPILIAVAALLLGSYAPREADAHGGNFRGPPGGVPPGLREPSDPEPPPPPPSDPGPPKDPITPTDDPTENPVTPEGETHRTPDDSAPPVPTPEQGSSRRRSGTKSLTFESWKFWWGYNNDEILGLRSHLTRGPRSGAGFLAGFDPFARLSPTRPARYAVQREVIPALLARLEDAGDHEDVHGGALIALGKVGEAGAIALFRDALLNRFTTSKGERVRFGGQATESAALALGLLPDLDAKEKAIVRRVCLEVIADDKQRTRERAWAAVALGLLRDREAVRPLLRLLEVKYPDDNVPAGILVGLGLCGDNSILDELCLAFKERKLAGQEISERVQAFVGYALMKLEDPRALDTMVLVLKRRVFGNIAKRSAVIAAGVLGAKADERAKEELFRVVKHFLDATPDPSSRNFATIALSQIGTRDCIEALLAYADNGNYGQRPFAALGLATRVYYRDRDAARGGGGMEPDLRAKIVARLGELGDRSKDTDTKSAFLLARGIVQDKTALDTLIACAGNKSGDPSLRGYACVALGLLGDASQDVKDALATALADGKKSADLRRDAALGLGLLKDARIVETLIEELKAAKTFAVQGGLITAIGTIGDHRALTPLVEILNDRTQPAQTRALAAVGLGMIGDLREIPALARLSQNYNYRASVKDLDELLYIY
ncbi:MAG: HEAT repeat domain-containing protein [Planctomycetaceae bacterium]